MMRFVLPILLWLAGLACLAGAQAILSRYVGGWPITALIGDMLPPVMLGSIIAVGSALTAMIVTVVSQRKTDAVALRRRRRLLLALGLVGGGFGLCGAGWSWLAMTAASQEVGGVTLEVAAPGWAELCLALAIGLLAAAIAFTCRTLR